MELLIASPDAVLAQVTTYTLLSPVKPVLILATLIPYMWVASKVEPDTRKYLLPVAIWNGVMVAAAAIALLAVLLIPIFWIGWPVMILLLVGTLYSYWNYRDKKVPEHARFALASGKLSKRIEERRAKKALAESVLRFIDPKGKPVLVPAKEAPEYPIHIGVENIIAPALSNRAARLDVVASGANQPFVPSHVIDGVRYKGEPIAPNDAVAAIDYLKKIAGLDVADRRRRQTAEIKVEGPTRNASVTFSTWGTSNGPSMRVDFDRAKGLQVPFGSLGLLPPQVEGLKAFVDPGKRHGIILVSAASGQGLTTTCLSLVGRHDAYTCNIKTLEKIVEVQLEGVDHNLFNPANPTVDFATSLQSILRRDPDVVLVSDVTEPGSGRIAASQGLNGPLVYVGVQADSLATAVSEWFRSVADLKLAARGMLAVSHQRLIRKVCEACRQPLQPTPDLLKKLGVPQGKTVTLFRQNGKVQVKNRIENCPVCQGLGYFGVTACFEVLFLDDATRSMLADGDFKSAYAQARRDGKLITLQEAAMAKVREGITTVDELARVFPPAKPAAPAATAAKS